ncbi:Spy/CpxP family protein refolding chaperone [Bradyrhizobium sp. AZCC 1610]|uniref:hypothetical protein n=1 Tax=Bradyrhizobium sp. AZCC 1610 TaxID=3117020 RepID=UPI002FF0AAA1
MRKPEGNKSDSTEHVVGRTPSDVVSQSLRLLGSLGPLIILASLGFYAILTFQDSLHRMHVANEDRFAKQFEAHIKSYDTMGKVSSSQVDQLSKLFDLTGKASAEAREADKKAQEQVAKATIAEAQQKVVQNALEKAKAELGTAEADLVKSQIRLAEQNKELEGIKINVSEIAKLVYEESWDKVIAKLNDLLKKTGSSINLQFDSEALSRLKELKTERESSVTLVPDEERETLTEQIRKYVSDNSKNQAAAKAWLTKNRVDMPIAIFLESPNGALKQRMVRELKIPPLPRITQRVDPPERSYAALFDPYVPSRHTNTYVIQLQTALCVPDSEIRQRGALTNTKALIQIYKRAERQAGDKLSDDDATRIREQGGCRAGGGQNYFEKRTFDDPSNGAAALRELIAGLRKTQAGATLSPETSLDGTRTTVQVVRNSAPPSAKLMALPPALSGQVTPDFWSMLRRL